MARFIAAALTCRAIWDVPAGLRFKIDDPKEMAEFYGVSLEEYMSSHKQGEFIAVQEH